MDAKREASNIKILYLDIENGPHLGHLWDVWNVNVGRPQLISQGEILCWSAMWHGTKKVMHASAWADGRKGMIEKMVALLDEADAVIHYNGIRHDIPHLNREMAEHEITPPRPYKNIDMFQTVKKRFKLVYKSLAYVLEFFGMPGKMSHEGHLLWVKVLAGDPAAQKRMQRYCDQDVRIMPALYEKLKPWIPNHPNWNLYRPEGTPEGCSKCGGELKRDGTVKLSAGTYQAFRCKVCGGWSRDGKRLEGATIQGVVL